MIAEVCSGPFTTATWWEPSECYGCPTCQDPGPLPDPPELLFISAGVVTWTLTDVDPDLD